jgi:hypothetical protein
MPDRHFLEMLRGSCYCNSQKRGSQTEKNCLDSFKALILKYRWKESDIFIIPLFKFRLCFCWQ